MVNDKILIEMIDDADRLRPLDQDHAELISVSIRQQGLLQPIRVRPLGDGRFKLVAGAHRLAALKRLQRVSLTVGEDVLIADVNDYAAKVDEIDENLARHELNALDRAMFMAKRKEFWRLANPDAGRGGDRKSLKFKKIKETICPFDLQKSFSASVAQKIGLSQRSIDRSIFLAEKLDRAAVRLLRGTKVERNQRELLAIADLAPDEQLAVAELIGGKKAKTLLQAKALLNPEQAEKPDPEAALSARVVEGYRRLSKSYRAQVLVKIKEIDRER